jgi:hypothetical protein
MQHHQRVSLVFLLVLSSWPFGVHAADTDEPWYKYSLFSDKCEIVGNLGNFINFMRSYEGEVTTEDISNPDTGTIIETTITKVQTGEKWRYYRGKERCEQARAQKHAADDATAKALLDRYKVTGPAAQPAQTPSEQEQSHVMECLMSGRTNCAPAK